MMQDALTRQRELNAEMSDARLAKCVLHLLTNPGPQNTFRDLREDAAELARRLLARIGDEN